MIMLWIIGASHFLVQIKARYPSTYCRCTRCVSGIRKHKLQTNKEGHILWRQWKVIRQRQYAFLLATIQQKPDSQVPSEREKPEMRAVSLGQTVKVQSSNWPFARNTSEWGVFVLILVNLVLFVASRFVWPSLLSRLVLSHREPRWWQFVTYSFCHESWSHLSNNLFFLLIFGKLVEEEEGALGIIMSYCVCAFGSALLSWLVLPKQSISIGASGAVFGLFTICVLTRFSWNWKRLLEFLILGQYVYQILGREVRLVTSSHSQKWSALAVNHIGHIAGSVTGILLVLFLRLIVASYSEVSSNKTG
ncbi:hypothetical protein GpartN1_g5797.t1 [Galdieria partita]|uniref:Peptidase S54 rhomboid domain-containing protein n=1 Tax=Galdieria partita TaxID=83374 RepID=A0A9C7USG4_9RHOD|nr:hypothetical protein GpartN1_g5797.t1 [Galdieria partita]